MGLEKDSNHQDRQLLLLRIDRYCHRKCISQQTLAKKAGISRTFFSNLQRGKVRWPQTNTLAKIAQALEISTEELCDCDDERNFQLGLSTGSTGNIGELDRRTNPVVTEISMSEPQLFAGWQPQDWEEIYSSFGVGGSLNEDGLKQVAARINEKRELMRKVQVILETHQSEKLEELVDSLYQSVRPDPNLYQPKPAARSSFSKESGANEDDKESTDGGITNKGGTEQQTQMEASPEIDSRTDSQSS
ncbi:Helix-turn-helix domain protein [Polystyrenella longa]|uniref:Helix-turn-helix domain protein n=1 Tax=Polystyrenella longa TaxID=2528007 RepID=A0A518CI47_9PLAN|nr:helix-turn-helix transcriptional regulator [Polystyrenella longa]QDU78903.1 Helix-turn-helix domain protein [Polystyrenella longa]